MILKRLKLLSLALIIIIMSDACASHHPNKKLKRGKPIPCPLKDC